ncbi:MAG: glycosyltransferase [Planctomycetes bacterium]|nr:glycosyltransferase [Planctomycetota bacterium]
MRILHIITRMILGGAQENTMLSVLGQAERPDLEVTLLSGPTTGPEGDITPLFLKSGGKLIIEPNLVRQLNPARDIAAYQALRKQIREFQPEVVHTHSSKAGILGRMAAWKEKVPLVVHTIHGLPFHPYQGWLANRIYVTAERFAARRCHRIVSVADAMTRQALAAGVGKAEQYRTVFSGMEIEPFLRRDRDRDELRQRFGLGNDDFVIGKIARLFELKGHEYLFQAFVKILQKHPQARLFLVGDGLWREKFEAIAQAQGFADRITFAGLVPRDLLPETIAAMDMVAHCSLREGLARVLPQALLSGKPVVSFDVDGAREVVINNQTGYLLPAQDVAALTSAIDDIITNPQKAAALAAAGCELCRKNFNWRVMVDNLCSLYAESLGNPA